MGLLDIFEKLPPCFVLDGYWDILLAIQMDLFKQEEWRLKLLEELLPLSGLPPNALEVILDDVLALLVEEKLVIPHKQGGYAKEEFEEVYGVLRSCIKNSPRRMVAWALWRAWTREKDKITVKDILREISYPDEVYEIILEEGSSSEHFGMSSRGFLLTNPYERIRKVKEIYFGEQDPHTIIKKIRELEAKEVSRILRRMGFKDERFENVNLERIRSILYECYGSVWPFFGNIVVKGDPYFKLFRGQSSTVYVDFPNEIIGYVIDKVGRASEASQTKDEFYNKAKMFLNEVNKRLNEVGIPWLKFSIQPNKFMKKPYGLKISIKWNKFIEYVESFSRAPTLIWEKYSYISSSRLPIIEILSRGSREKRHDYTKRVQNGVRALCTYDMKSIDDGLDDIKDTLNTMQKNLWRLSNRGEVPLAMLVYLLEAEVIIETIRQMAKNGLFPSCYRELRKFLENLSWAFFGDYLLIKAYKRYGLPYPSYALLVSKGWYEWRDNKKVMLNVKTARDRVNKLHEKLKQTYPALPGKDKFWSTVISGVTFPSFTFLFGKRISSERLPMEVPRYLLHTQIIPYAIKDFENIGKRFGLPNPEAFGKDVIDVIIKIDNKIDENLAFIIPPYPTNDLVLTFVEKWFGVNKKPKLTTKYDEYSTFVHSYPESWVVFPFSSVIEVKVFKKEIMEIESLIKELCRAYLNIFKAKSQHSSKKKV